MQLYTRNPLEVPRIKQLPSWLNETHINLGWGFKKSGYKINLQLLVAACGSSSLLIIVSVPGLIANGL